MLIAVIYCVSLAHKLGRGYADDKFTTCVNLKQNVLKYIFFKALKIYFQLLMICGITFWS